MADERGDLVPIAPCASCGRFTEDPNRDAWGEPIHENPEDDLEALCERCQRERFGEALRADTVQIIDETLGLGETDRRAIRSFIETIFTDPKKILQVQDLDNRVRSLERQVVIMWGVIGSTIIVLLIAIVTMK